MTHPLPDDAEAESTMLLKALSPWLMRQRWFAGKSREPRLEILAVLPLPVSDDSATASIYLVLDHSTDPLLYQVPLVERFVPRSAAEAALVGTIGSGSGRRYLYDGPHDPAYSSALFGLIADGGETLAADGAGRATGHSELTTPLVVAAARVLGGEQSNTSIVYETAGYDGRPSWPVVCKLFRTIHDGENPDVVLTTALGAAGSEVAPRPIGNIAAQWPDRSAPGGVASGHLAFAEEFLPGAVDGWQVALEAAAAGDDFTVRARELGRTTADMHATLASALPALAASPAEIAAVLASMHERFERAVRAIPALGAHRAAIERVYSRAAASPWPRLQRIHGDLHLGQVLSAPNRGWVMLDFEGEPLRPMRERSRPDVPLRDVAGMLRSFDYVSGSLAMGAVGIANANWVADAREAYLQGYSERLGVDLREHHALLDAFEIDKALYEAVYEARNRPGWLAIPLAAIEGLLQ